MKKGRSGSCNACGEEGHWAVDTDVCKAQKGFSYKSYGYPFANQYAKTKYPQGYRGLGGFNGNVASSDARNA